MEKKTPTGIAVKCDNCHAIAFQGNVAENVFRHQIWVNGWEKPESGVDFCGACSNDRAKLKK
jgi:hypothetical protein